MAIILITGSAPAVGAEHSNAALVTNKGDLSFILRGNTTSGTGAARVRILGGHETGKLTELLVFDLTLSSTETIGGDSVTAYYPILSAEIVSISGTGATVTATMGE